MTDKGFIFDLDGVVVDTARYHYKAWNRLATQLGFVFTQEHNELLKGVSRKKSLDILLNIGNITASEDQKQQWMEAKNQEYLEYIQKMTPDEILPNVPYILKHLKEEGHHIALGSASKNAVQILQKIMLFDAFDVIVDGTHVSKAKPDPEVFLKAAQEMNIRPENCVVFEDAVAGIQAAKAANMYAIGIGKKEVLIAADEVFPDFTTMTPQFLGAIWNVPKV
ncbi:beta-phosphoglucomutase [Aquimarina addita]|uniref:Beta-phosphoglucomutase n=1 Tax=Aquimarina addita TaxID=870485 RepID=A0ABP6UWW5_9FLAO